MEAGSAGFIQEALRGILKCLGLEGGGGKAVTGGEEVVNNPPPSPSLDPTPYEPLPAAAADDTTTIVDVLSSTRFVIAFEIAKAV
ncbi:uncharacterized protein LOC110917526 isoform X2 [Helianthus annuus]|uniref:uncharacterized protein LOC110917526 isoform X2 n=1 Tax=Helianthus annuus TaxID=4232 RepID=UPI000B8FBC93|nr:uncharacterized protein LOC110917526 isoform X2 [Helianthus annuus]